mgnify:CR=1 FL=1
MVNIITGYGRKMSEATEISDQFSTVTDMTTTGLADLGEAMKIAGPVAAGMNIPMEETLAILGGMGQAGFKGSLAGTALRGALSTLAVPAKEAKDALKGLGISGADIVDSKGNVKSLMDVLVLLEKKGATTADVLTIFGERAGPAMAGLLGIGTTELHRYQDALENSAGAAARKAEITTAGAAGAFDRMWAAIKNAGIAVAESGLLEWISKLAEKVSKLVTWLSELSPTTLAVLTVIGGLVAAVGPAIFILGQLAIGIQAITAVWGMLNLAFLASPIGWVIGIIALLIAAGVLLYTQWDKIKLGWMVVWNWIKEHTTAVVGFLMASPIGMLIAGGILLAKHWDTISSKIGGYWDFIKEKVSSVVDWILDKIQALNDMLPEWAKTALSATVPGFGIVSEIASSRLEQAAAAPDSKAQATVRVEFDRMPEGTRVESTSNSGVPLNLSMGYAMGI